MPIEDYHIDLNLTDAPPARFKYPVGNRVPLRETVDGNKNDTSYWSALSASTIPHKIGVASSVYTDRILRAYDENDNFDNVDPSFDPVKVWKDNKHNPEEFAQIGPMKNWEQYSFYTTMKDYETKNLERIENSGLTGNAAAFVAQLATDPTTYAGFGAAKMLSKGMAAKSAYALSGVAAGATYEGLQQIADVNEQRSATESLTTIAAAGVMGSVLGSAVDTWVSRKAAGALKGTEGKDFHQASMQYIDDAVTIEQRAESAGAAAVVKDPNMSRISGLAARNVAYGLRRIAPRLLGQTAGDDLSRTTAEKFFGRTLKTEGDVAGLQRVVSFRDNLDTDLARYQGKIEKSYDEFRSYVKSGKLITEDDMRQAILRVADVNDNLADDSASAVLGRAHRDFFNSIADESKDISGFNYRQGYTPMVFNRDAINKNFNAFKDKFTPMFLKAKADLADDALELSNKITAMGRNKASVADIEDLQDELNQIRSMMNESDSDSIANATLYASRFASGELGAQTSLNPFYNKSLPSRFKQRLFDVRDFAEFIEVNPLKLQYNYKREVMPFIASQKTYGDRTPLKQLQIYKDQFQEKIADALAKGDSKLAAKLEMEKIDITDSITKGWDDVTGATNTRASALLGGPAMNMIRSAKDWTAATSLGAVVLASLTEPVAITLTHGLKKLPGYSRLISQMATSPEIRQFVRNDANYLSHAISTGVHYRLMNNFMDEMANAEIAGSGITGKIAKTSQMVGNASQLANGNVTYTSGIRSTLAVAQQGIMKESLVKLIDVSINEARKTDLAFLGVSTKAQAKMILKQAQKYGKEEQGNFVFNLGEWDDKEARRLIEVALTRDNMRTSLNPGVGDVPHLFHIPGANLFTQFKSWGVMATHNFGISALQRNDSEHLMNISAYVGLSSAAYMLAEVARGNPPPTDVDEIIYSGVTNSGLVGVLPDYGGHYLMNTLFNLESGGAKFAERQDLQSTIMGPLGTKLQDVQGSIARPVGQALNPNKDVQFDDTWAKNMMDILPVPFIKPLIKNELLTDD